MNREESMTWKRSPSIRAPGAVTTILAAAALAAGLSSCKTIEGPASGPGDGTPEPASSRVVVDIVDFAFVGPDGTDVVAVSPGDTVVFVNRDAAPHTATATSWPGDLSFDSGPLQKDESWEFVAPAAGEWVYRCDFHPAGMRDARIVVTGSGGSGEGPPLDGGDEPAGGDAGSGAGDGGTGSGGASGSGTPSGSVRIEMRNSRFFAPNGTDTVTIALGQTVDFVNADNSSHTATSTSGPSSFNSGRLREGQSYSWKPATTRTWVYRCDYHHDTMTGAVIRVDEAGGSRGGGGSGGGGAGGGSGSVVPIQITASGYAGPGGSADVAITLGQTVEWVNGDAVVHAVRSTDEPRDAADFDSGDIAPGQSFRFTPDARGTWLYRCRYHGDERDLVITVS